MTTARRRGTILVLTMVIVFMLAAMVLTLGRQVHTQSLASANDLAAQKADAAERGAEQYVLSLLTDYRDTLPTLTETEFSAVPVGDAFFWIVRPTYDDADTPAWGLVDENSKLDLNVATEAQLSLLPGMTTELVASIVQWRGTGLPTNTTAADATAAPATPSDGQTKGSAFETVDELLLVPGMTHELLYGTPSTDGAPAADGDWVQRHGLFDYFTVWSRQPNTAADGTARVSINAADQRQQLTELLAQYLPNNDRANQVVNSLNRPGPGGSQPKRLTGLFSMGVEATLKPEEFAAIEDYLTVDAQKTSLIGRVNFNTAPREVLLTINNIAETDVDKLLQARATGIASYPNSLAWVQEALAAGAESLDTYVTPRGRHFSADIVAASGNGRGFRRVRIVVDTTTTPARIVYRRDLTDRGWPMDEGVLDQLKAGTFAGGTAAAAGTTAGASGWR